MSACTQEFFLVSVDRCRGYRLRPWRSPTEATAEWLRDLQHQPNLSVDEVWGQLCDEYSRWRTDDVVAVAEPYFNRTGPQLPEPSFVANATEWWACMVYQKLQHLELVLSRKKSVKNSTPTTVDGVPVDDELPAAEGDHKDASDDNSSADGKKDGHARNVDDEDMPDPDATREDMKGNYPAVTDVLCSPLPVVADLSTFLGEPGNMHKRGPEAAYAREYMRHAPVVATSTSSNSLTPLPAEKATTSASTEWINAMALAQEDFFVRVDRADLHVEVTIVPDRSDDDQRAKTTSKESVHALLSSQNHRQPSRTYVLEAAIDLIHRGVCDVRQSQQINVKWAMALLHFAAHYAQSFILNCLVLIQDSEYLYSSYL